MLYSDLTEKIIACAYKVYNKMGYGYLESVYEKCMLIELKSVTRIVKAHEVQLVNYLVTTNKPVGLILNFAKDKVEVKRKVKDL